ncbi:hypothetical protein ACOME3_007914 [Neoechinorhynchus agilis]
MTRRFRHRSRFHQHQRMPPPATTPNARFLQLQHYLSLLDTALSQHDNGQLLYRLMSHRFNRVNATYEMNSKVLAGRQWREVLIRWLETNKMIAMVTRSNIEKAFQTQLFNLRQYLEIMPKCSDLSDRQKYGILRALCVEARLLSYYSRTNDRCSEVSEVLMNAFRQLSLECRRNTSSPSAHLVCVVNQLFKLYVRMKMLNLCKPITKALESIGGIDCAQTAAGRACAFVPMCEKITYKYYLARYYLDQCKDQRETARKLFEEVFKACEGKQRNKITVLDYLIPLNMSIGRFPRPELLYRHYDRAHASALWTIRTSIIGGNINQFSSVVNSDNRLIKNGTYHLYGPCTLLTVRNLFKRLQRVLTPVSDLQEHKLTNKICLKKAVAAVELMPHVCKETRLVDSIEDLMLFTCQLVDKGLMKGYLSEKHATIVISKDNPFPGLANLHV